VSTEEPKTYSAPNSLIDLVVPLVRVRPSEFNPRKHFDEAALLELSASIREHGLLEPIVVRVIEGGNVLEGPYQIVAGERRYRACVMAGLGQVAVRIHPSLDDATALRLAIIENVQRVDLDPIEEAAGYRALAELGMKQREIAESVKRSQPAVANAMRLLDLPESVQAKITAGDLSASHGIALASLKANSHVQEALAELAVKAKWPTKKLEGYFADLYSYNVPGSLNQHVYELRGGSGWNWKAECQGQCPYDAFRATQWDHIAWCLRPGCYEDKRKAAQQAEEAAAAARVEESRAKGTTAKTTDFGKYDGDGYHTINTWTTLPEGCEPGCPKRIKALGSGNIELEICSDAKCWKRLEMAAMKAKNKTGRTRAKQMLVDVEKRVDELWAFGDREMAVLAALAMSDFRNAGKVLEDTLARHGLDPKVAAAIRGDDWDHATGKQVTWSRYDVLSECSALTLARIILEVAIRTESKNLSENPQWAKATPIADWYLAKSDICPTAGLPCDPATCVQRCPKAEAAQQQPSLTPNAHLCLCPVTVSFQWKNGAKSGTVFACDTHGDEVMHYVCRLGEIVSRSQVSLAAAGKLVCAHGQAWPTTRGEEESA
jgi:ParB/RepB/Spo0J family partition protein